MKTRTEARIWVYQKVVAHSLRQRAPLLKASDIVAGITPAGVKRAQAEMVKLADWLDAKAEKLQRKVDTALLLEIIGIPV